MARPTYERVGLTGPEIIDRAALDVCMSEPPAGMSSAERWDWHVEGETVPRCDILTRTTIAAIDLVLALARLGRTALAADDAMDRPGAQHRGR